LTSGFSPARSDFLKGRFFTDGLGLGITYLHPDVAKEWQSSHSSTSPSITAYFYRDASTGAFRLVALFKTLPDTKGELDTVFSATTEQLTKVIGPQPDIIKTTWNGNTKYHPPARVAHWETAQEILFLGAHAGLFDEKDISRKVGYISRDEWQKYLGSRTDAYAAHRS
jgi:hypothetical protein